MSQQASPIDGVAHDQRFAGALSRVVNATSLHLLLDYDGTLVPLAATPPEASPDAALLSLLQTLAECPSTEITIVSGRDARTLDEWLGRLPVSLVAEHGAHSRSRGEREWKRSPAPDWKHGVLRAALAFCEHRPGTLVEEKDCTIALHTRQVRHEVRARTEDEAEAVFRAIAGVSVLRGNCVVEAKNGAHHKGRVLEQLTRREGQVILAAGDDVTDEDLFSALPSSGVAIAVGSRPRGARHRVDSAVELRALLQTIASARARPCVRE